jgi:Erythromycin biosynthesis protein CIII-like, C-terminal domain
MGGARGGCRRASCRDSRHLARLRPHGPEGIGLELPTKTVDAPGRPHIDICPPSLQDKEFVATQERIELRPVPYSAAAAPPTWVSRRTSRPIVYLTLGTAFGTPELLTTAIEGLARLDARVVVAAGRVRPDQLGDVPDNVTVQPWVAQAKLLPHVDVVVHHGGSGTTLGALAVGAPQLILPQGADQFANADAVGAAGAGVLLLPDELSANAIAEAHAQAAAAPRTRRPPRRGPGDRRGDRPHALPGPGRPPSPGARSPPVSHQVLHPR